MLEDASEYIGKRVKLSYVEKGKSKTIEGLCVTYKPDRAWLVQRAKRSYPDLIEAGWVMSVEKLIDIPKLTVSTVKPVEYYDVRRHLLNMHGWTLSEVNTITDETAMKRHDLIHSSPESDLGHTHSE